MGKTKTFIEVQMQFSRYRTLKDFVTKTKEYMVGFVKSKRAV